MSRPGEIAVDRASRHFKVYPREARRLMGDVELSLVELPAEVG